MYILRVGSIVSRSGDCCRESASLKISSQLVVRAGEMHHVRHGYFAAFCVGRVGASCQACCSIPKPLE
jgi:hypothetical protein